MDKAFAVRLRSGQPQLAAGAQHSQPAPRWRGRSPSRLSPQGRGNGTRGWGRGRAQQPRRYYCLFHGEDCAHPTRDCPETKPLGIGCLGHNPLTTKELSRTHINTTTHNHTTTATPSIYPTTHISTTRRYKSYHPHSRLRINQTHTTKITPKYQNKKIGRASCRERVPSPV